MAFDETSLHDKYSLAKVGVASGTQISNRTSAVVEKLEAGVAGGESKPPLVALTAGSKAGSKLISIAEIAKRELAAKGVKVFQYNALSSRLTEVERRPQKTQDRGAEAEEDESDDAFEKMGGEEESKTKKRNVPVLTVYLATEQVKELKAAYGEQT